MADNPLISVPLATVEAMAQAPMRLAKLEAAQLLQRGDISGAAHRLSDGATESAAIRARYAPPVATPAPGATTAPAPAPAPAPVAPGNPPAQPGSPTTEQQYWAIVNANPGMGESAKLDLLGRLKLYGRHAETEAPPGPSYLPANPMAVVPPAPLNPEGATRGSPLGRMPSFGIKRVR